MPVSLSCEHCQTKLKIPTPVHVGRVVRCPKCDGQFRVKATLSSASEEAVDETSAQDSPPRGRPKDRQDETPVGKSSTGKARVARPEDEDEKNPKIDRFGQEKRRDRVALRKPEEGDCRGSLALRFFLFSSWVLGYTSRLVEAVGAHKGGPNLQVQMKEAAVLAGLKAPADKRLKRLT